MSELSTSLRELIDRGAEPVTPAVVVQRGTRHRRWRRTMLVVLVTLAAIGAGAVTTVVWPRAEHSVRMIGAGSGPFPDVPGFVAPPGSTHPPFVSVPLRSIVLRYAIADLGPESGDGSSVHGPALMPATLYETTYDAHGDWVERSVGGPSSSVQEYRDGVRTLSSHGQVISRTTIDPVNRPYQPHIELTRFRATFIADQELRQNRDAKVGSERVHGVHCRVGPPCVEVLYTRTRVFSRVQVDNSPMSLYRVGDNSEDATLVYDPQTKLVRYYRERVNGLVTHEFKLVEAQTVP
jgi:hypothetical protein